MALNFKNPQGRLLRRQWTSKLKSVPSFQNWREQKDEVDIPTTAINISATQLGLITENTKFCFPYDNSVIRVQKNSVGSRRFGTSLVLKDNLKFGIKERQSDVDEKVPCQDEILNNETKKEMDRRCEFWCDFENGVRLHTEMMDQVKSKTELIPPISNETVAVSESQKRVKIEDVEIQRDIATVESGSRSMKSANHKSSLR